MSVNIKDLLGKQADYLLNHTCKTISKEHLHVPGSDFIDRIFTGTNRSPQVLRSLGQLYNSGRLAGTGYMSILPVDQGIEHSAGASFAPNPMYFDSENIVKINHNEFLTYPNKFDQIMFGSVEEAWNMGAVAVGATIYFGSPESSRQIVEVAQAFERAHELGMATVLWCYTRNPGFKKDGVDYHTAADLSSQANHLGVTIQADIIKQKLSDKNGGYTAINFGKTHPKVYSELSSDHPIDLCRYQVANCYMGRMGLINSGGESKGESDLAEAISTAVINKRAGGQGLISGRKAFQKPLKEGVTLLNAIQDVYLDANITLA